MSEFDHTPVRGVQFDLVDLPPEGLDLEGVVPALEIGLEDEERLRYVSGVSYKLHLEAINSGHDLLVRGNVAVDMESVCDRCERAYSWKIDTNDVCHEFENAFGTTIDLSDGLREDILMSFPQHFLCKEDCLGLCPQCGANWNDGPCDCPEDVPADDSENPWAALDQLNPQK